MLRILSLGAGVQSTTLALMVAHGEFPERLDGAIFADTQWEPAEVYKHLDWLEPRLPFPVYRVTAGSIRDSIIARRNTTGGRYAAVPWFTVNVDGSHGINRRQCTSEYKLNPIMRKTRDLLGVGRRSRIPAGTVEQWIGISRDEATRMKDARQQWIRNRWPLIERFMSRDDCVRWLTNHGYHEPPKSACLGCPFRSQKSWQQIQRDQPEAFADAVAVDEALRLSDSRGMRSAEYMHSARIPLALAVALKTVEPEPNLFENECEGMCGV